MHALQLPRTLLLQDWLVFAGKVLCHLSSRVSTSLHGCHTFAALLQDRLVFAGKELRKEAASWGLATFGGSPPSLPPPSAPIPATPPPAPPFASFARALSAVAGGLAQDAGQAVGATAGTGVAAAAGVGCGTIGSTVEGSLGGAAAAAGAGVLGNGAMHAAGAGVLGGGAGHDGFQPSTALYTLGRQLATLHAVLQPIMQQEEVRGEY